MANLYYHHNFGFWFGVHEPTSSSFSLIFPGIRLGLASFFLTRVFVLEEERRGEIYDIRHIRYCDKLTMTDNTKQRLPIMMSFVVFIYDSYLSPFFPSKVLLEFSF